MSQNSQKFDMPSGAVLVITIAPFIDAWSLMKAALKTLKGTDLKSEDLKQDAANILKNASAFSMILDRVVDLATSPDVEVAVWKCAQRALYIPAGSDPIFPGIKVDQKLFDDPDHGISAREDYSKIISGIMEVNCKPFLVKALSGLLKQKESTPENQLSKSA